DLFHLGDPVTGAPDAYADQAFGGADRDTFTGVGAGDSVFGGSEGDDWDTLDLRGTGPREVVRTNVDSDGNGFDGYVNYLDGDGNVVGRSDFTNIESIVCFTPGTLIATPKGEIAVEQLRVGDKVITRDNGIQEIRWMGAKEMGWHDFAGNPHLRPVMVKAGSLGNGLPERDMMLSPNHRLLVANDRTALYFDEHEVLVAAKHLIGGQGIHQVESVGTTYIHFMFDQHEVVLSNGAWTESFQPGDFSLKGLGNAQRNELIELFPELKAPAGADAFQAARKTLKKHEASLLAR
ncbi:MAG: Hint domain-containing protein, partial [Pseudorhodobacter sp.]|nr:Hint domain-containing protein [Pseudorhodobacter sp.]